MVLTILVAGYGIFQWQTKEDTQDIALEDNASPNSAALVSVTLPEQLSNNAIMGKRIFYAKCALCHGQNAAGKQGIAPPLIHKIYEPSHHGDESFYRAVAVGTRAHHWPFGDMPPVDGLTRDDVSKIITYVRELQRANGIN